MLFKRERKKGQAQHKVQKAEIKKHLLTFSDGHTPTTYELFFLGLVFFGNDLQHMDNAKNLNFSFRSSLKMLKKFFLANAMEVKITREVDETHRKMLSNFQIVTFFLKKAS